MPPPPHPHDTCNCLFAITVVFIMDLEKAIIETHKEREKILFDSLLRSPDQLQQEMRGNGWKEVTLHCVSLRDYSGKQLDRLFSALRENKSIARLKVQCDHHLNDERLCAFFFRLANWPVCENWMLLFAQVVVICRRLLIFVLC